MSEIYKVFDDSGLTALTDHMKTTRTKANSNEAAIETLGEDLVELSSEVVAALGNKQDTLTFDTAPKYNSTNPVTSGGIYTALLDKQNKVTGEVGQYMGFNAAGFPTAKDFNLPTGFARCAGTYDSSTNRYTVELPDAMDSIPTGYAFILIPDTDNAAEDVDIYANYKTAGGQSKSSIVELRFRNMPENSDSSSVVPSGAIKQNVPLMVVKGAVYWFIDSIHYHLFDSGITTAGDGAAYTATVSGIESLTAGISFIMIPHTASTSQTATLNVNGLGAKQLRRPLSSNNTTTVANSVTNWMYAGKPVRVMYNGTFWIVMDMPRPHATDLYGTVAIENGGTGATTAEAALTNLGAMPAITGTEGQIVGFDSTGAPVAQDIPPASADGVTTSLSTTWTEQADGTFAQSISVQNVTANNQIVVDCSLSGTDIDADVAVLEAWGCVNRCDQAAGTLTFYCYGDIPTVAIPVNVVVM